MQYHLIHKQPYKVCIIWTKLLQLKKLHREVKLLVLGCKASAKVANLVFEKLSGLVAGPSMSRIINLRNR